MIPALFGAGIEFAAATGFMQPIMGAAVSALLPQLNTMNIHSGQEGFYTHPVMPPSPDVMLNAWVRGFFPHNTFSAGGESLESIFVKMMRSQGCAIGSEGYNKFDKVNWDPYRTAWDTVADAMVSRPGIREAFTGLISGFLTMEEFTKMMKRNGALAEDWLWLQPFLCQRLSPAELIPLYNRGLVKEAEFDQYLKLLQYGVPADREKIKELSKEMPGYTDIVRFAVRDAFNPKQVKALGLDLELDENPEYLDFAKAAGLGNITIVDSKGEKITRNMAALNWYAHWQLPSPGQAYQFMHQLYPDSRYGKSPMLSLAPAFAMPELENLLKANDYSPMFRKHLAAISFHPFTRIDVRRVRKAGLISKADVYHNYRRSGYQDFEANAMTEYVEKEIGESVNLPERKAIKGRTCKAFQLGIIDAERMRQVMAEAKFPQDEINLHVHTCEIDQALGIAKEGIASVKAGYFTGALDEREAMAQLKDLGIKDAKITEYMFIWNHRLNNRRRVVAAKEVSAWFIDDIISEEDFVSRLTKLDYYAVDVTRMVQAAKLEKVKRLSKLQKQAATEMTKAIEKNLKETEKARKQQEQLHRQRQSELRRQIEEQERIANQRMQRFLSARTEANLRAWLKNGDISENEVRSTFNLKGWSSADIERWLNDARRRNQ